MIDVLESPVRTDDYQTMDLIADISELHVEARRRLMAVFYEFRERERQLQAEVLRLRRGLSRTHR